MQMHSGWLGAMGATPSGRLPGLRLGSAGALADTQGKEEGQGTGLCPAHAHTRGDLAVLMAGCWSGAGLGSA